ncbi:MAG: hypothetical protein WBD20_11760 [Pirellulaceae bacterium]
MKESRSLFASVLAIVALAIFIVPLTFYLFNRPRIPNVVLPVPNAYDTITRASAATVSIPDDYGETDDVERLRNFIAGNGGALSLIDQALRQECAIPVDYSGGQQALLDSAGVNRPASRMLIAKARLAELENDLGSAAVDYAKMLVLNSKMTNGGLLVHLSGAFAYERDALENLAQIIPKLTTAQRAPVKKLFDQAKRKPIDFGEIANRESTLRKLEYGTLRGTILSSATTNQTQFIDQTKAVDEQIMQLYADAEAAFATPVP